MLPHEDVGMAKKVVEDSDWFLDQAFRRPRGIIRRLCSVVMIASCDCDNGLRAERGERRFAFRN